MMIRLQNIKTPFCLLKIYYTENDMWAENIDPDNNVIKIIVGITQKIILTI